MNSIFSTTVDESENPFEYAVATGLLVSTDENSRELYEKLYDFSTLGIPLGASKNPKPDKNLHPRIFDRWDIAPFVENIILGYSKMKEFFLNLQKSYHSCTKKIK